MATDVVIIDGDKISFSFTTPPSGPPTIPAVSSPVSLTGTGFTTVNDKAVCLDGDELPTSLQVPLVYSTSTYSVPGQGTLTVTLNANNKTSIFTDNDSKVLLNGSAFQAKFEVTSPATLSSTPFTPDPTPSYSGTASFISTNTLVEAE